MASLMVAPMGSTFVCQKVNVSNVQKVADSIGRDDLHIVNINNNNK